MLKINDTVIWRGSWGTDKPKEVKVTKITKDLRFKNDKGTDVSEISWDEVEGRSVIVILDNGHWAYGNQLSPLEVA